MRPLIALSLLLAATAGAQPPPTVVDPGMTKAQVIAKLGNPAVERTTGNSTFLFYPNRSEQTDGMSDVVLLAGDQVVDAVFRSPARKYSGASSSPAAIPADSARKLGKLAAAEATKKP